MAERRKFEIDDQQDQVYTGGGGKQTLSVPAGLELFKPKKSGTFRIEVIPFRVSGAVTKFVSGYRFSPPNKWHWNVMYRMHGGVGPENKSVVCTYGTFGTPCPICEQRAVFNRSPHKEDKASAKALGAKERQLLLVAERDDRSGSLGPILLWEVSTFCFQKQLDLFLDASDAEDMADRKLFWHPERGMTLKIAVSEEAMGATEGGRGGSFAKFTPMELKPRREPLDLDLFDHKYDLHAMVRAPQYKDVKQLFHGVDPDDVPGDQGGSDEGQDFDAPNPAVKRNARPGDDEQDPEPPPAKAPIKKTTPAPVAKYVPEEGDTVTVEFKGDQVTGRVLSVDSDKEIAQVKIPGKDRPGVYDWEEIKLSDAPGPDEEPARGLVGTRAVKAQKTAPAEPDEAPEPPAKPATKARGGWDDDEDNLPPPPKSRK